MVEFNIKTSKKNELVNITLKIKEIVSDSKIKKGVCLVYCPHTTAGIVVNENSDPAVCVDLLEAFEKIVPKISFKHSEGNSDAHLKSTLVGCEKTFIISNEELSLGVWQAIFFAEFDGPRERKVFVELINNF